MALSKFSGLSTPDIGETPHQPTSFLFPKREFGKKTIVKRPFQPSWFSQYKWIHYDEKHDLAYCHTCIKAYIEKKLRSSCVDPAFISTGFCNWKDGSVKLRNHESSKCHAEAVLKIFTLPSTTRDIGETLSTQHKKDTLERRQCFLKILSNIRFLARQGLPFRGDGDEGDSNFIQLCKLRGEDNPKLLEWLKRKTDKYTSAEMQNDILKVMALQLLRKVAASLQSASFYTIMVDETTDTSNREQVVICFRFVDDNFEVHEEFIGLYMVESICADTLVEIIKDTLIRMNLALSKARGQCYDGASSMAGSRSGVAKQITDEKPRAVYTHCYGHALNLACGDTIRQIKMMQNALDLTHEVTKLIKLSPRRDVIFQNLKESVAPDSPGIRLLCPTRWTVRAKALKSILDNYSVLQQTWDEAVDIVKDAPTRARILGVSAHMRRFDFFFGVVLGEFILRHSDNLSRTLQRSDISAAEGQEVAELTIQTLSSCRTDDKFQLFWKNLLSLAEEKGVPEPELPRLRKTPRRYDIGSGEPEACTSPSSYYRMIYYEALDLIINCIRNRFDQPGYRVYRNLQDILLKAAKNTDYQAEFDFITKFYGQDFDAHTLKVQLEQYTALFTKTDTIPTIENVFSFMRSLSQAQKSLLSEICTVTKLILVIPATNAVSERSFSALRRVKTYLRSTMSQGRLNHLMLLHVHKNLTDGLDLIKVANEFVSVCEHRLSVFGRFQESDLV